MEPAHGRSGEKRMRKAYASSQRQASVHKPAAMKKIIRERIYWNQTSPGTQGVTMTGSGVMAEDSSTAGWEAWGIEAQDGCAVGAGRRGCTIRGARHLGMSQFLAEGLKIILQKVWLNGEDRTVVVFNTSGALGCNANAPSAEHWYGRTRTGNWWQ